MRSTVRGGYKTYFARTMERVFGSAGRLDEIVPSGMTDTQIMYESLRGAGFTPKQIFLKKDELLPIFQTEMRKVLAENGEPYEVLKGVTEILAQTDRDARFVNAILNGNL